MNSRKRRREKRLRARLASEFNVTLPTPPLSEHMKHKEAPPSQSRAELYFARTISRTKLLFGLFVSAATLLGGFALLRPNASVDPDLLLNPGDPFSTQFSVKNENIVFDATDLRPSCRTLYVMTSNNVRQMGLPPLPSPTIPVLSPGQTTTIDCRPWLGGLGAGAGKVLSAYIEIDVNYKQDWWFGRKRQEFPFKGVTDSEGGVHWTHITPAQLQAIFSRRPN